MVSFCSSLERKTVRDGKSTQPQIAGGDIDGEYRLPGFRVFLTTLALDCQ
jgi:hypothetical protein